MERIVIIGCGGSGKSTLARALSTHLALPVCHLDKLYWRSGWVPVPLNVFDEQLLAWLTQPRWIVDGNYDRTISLRVSYCDTVIYLDYSRLTCLCGAIKRVFTNRGRTRPDMAEGCPEHMDAEFFRWIWSYRHTHRNANLAMLSQLAARGVQVLRFTSRRACAQWLASLPPTE